jgi:putative (di)nucleoside polyphosphate hydrolase
LHETVIDSDGFRPNVGIILANPGGRVLWARRVGQDAWQFPQGGIKAHEDPEQALYRELREEVGLGRRDVEVMGCTRGWLRYTLPKRYVRRHCEPVCIGQKQVWFLLRLRCCETTLRLDATPEPEFDHWKWVSYWQPAKEVIYFKREVYRRALKELAPLIGVGRPGPICGSTPPASASRDSPGPATVEPPDPAS